MSIAITEAITTLAEAERRFHLSRSEDEAFFSEWQVSLPELSRVEQAAIDQLRQRYLYQRSEGQWLEGTVTLLLASPLLTVAGFYDPPFRVPGGGVGAIDAGGRRGGAARANRCAGVAGSVLGGGAGIEKN